jgi:hypothetical protein
MKKKAIVFRHTQENTVLEGVQCLKNRLFHTVFNWIPVRNTVKMLGCTCLSIVMYVGTHQELTALVVQRIRTEK